MKKRAVFSFAIVLASVAMLSSGAYAFRQSRLPAGSSADDPKPILIWNTFLGSPSAEYGEAVATDAAGNVYVGGSASASWGVPVRPYSGGGDTFVAKLDGTGHFVWLTFLGGAGSDSGCSIAVDKAGGIFVSGKSYASWGVPVRPWSGAADAFIAKLAPDGSLLWNTFLGSTADDEAFDIAVDGTGKSIVVGQTGGPSWGTPLRSREGNTDGFVAILDAAGALEANSFLGGINHDAAMGVAWGADQNIYITGWSRATWGVPVTPFGGPEDLFAAKLTADGNLVWNTFRGLASYSGTYGNAIAVDETGRTFLAGVTTEWCPLHTNDYKGFVLALSDAGAPRWETPLLSGAGANAWGILLNKEGNIFVIDSFYNSAPGGYSSSFSGIAKLSPAGALNWNYSISAKGIALDEAGRIDVVGTCDWSWGDPINPFAGSYDVFVAEIVEPFKLSSPNGGESWAAGTSRNIQWSAEDTIPSIRLEYSTDAGVTWNVITASSPNDGSYEWLVPRTPSGQCLVRIIDVSNFFAYDWSDAVFSIIISPSPVIGLSPGALRFGASGGTTTGPLSLLVDNLGGGALNWTAASDRQWLALDPVAGSGSGQIAVRAVPGGLPPGSYEAHITITAPGALNSPKSISVFLQVCVNGATWPPFGSFDTPNSGATVSSSIAVTGWALDDIETTSVKIYRDPVGNEPAGQWVYIGDATFVEGSRPDVELAYPTYPLNSRAGWGYMLLTNFLPNGGNGAFALYALAIDKEGHEVSLGSKTISCDNARAVKPFGAIDTPEQGGTASGAGYLNFGWALTPPPNNIPADGSTLGVWVDGVLIGHPLYNNYRGDIATLFPGYANSNGAVGVFTLDTTAYANGVHTIAWSVVDNAGNEDGIGSRYFSILNTGTPSPQAEALSRGSLTMLSELSGYRDISLQTIYARKGFDRSRPPDRVLPTSVSFASLSQSVILSPGEGSLLTVHELERIEILLDVKAFVADAERRTAERAGYFSAQAKALPGPAGSRWEGYLIVGEELRPLPIGSTLDAAAGVFSWLPGPSFLGDYRLVFVDHENRSRSRLAIRIEPLDPKIE
jgi:hypothetical protein